MIPGRHDHEAVRPERVGGQGAHIDGAGDDADVGHALGNQAHDLIRKPFFQVDAHLRIRRQEGRQGLGQEFGQRIGVGQQAHFAGGAAGVGAEIFAQPRALGQQGPRMFQQGQPGGRRGDALP